MTAKQQEPERVSQRSEQQRLEAVIGGHVLDLLGRPKNLRQARARYLWKGHYRVNILVGEDAVFADIAHSYFLTVDGAGNIVQCNPPIRKTY